MVKKVINLNRVRWLGYLSQTTDMSRRLYLKRKLTRFATWRKELRLVQSN